jgi:hypothetical protein
MSTYFKAAERCGLRANTEGLKRAAHRCVAGSTPAPLRQETAVLALKEAHDVVVATGARPPPTETIEVDDALLPFSAERLEHRRQLEESTCDISLREGKDLSDFQQEKKVQTQRERELQEALQAERDAEQERQRLRAEREAAVRQMQEETRQKLRDAYGPCFLWNTSSSDGDAQSLSSSQVSSSDASIPRRRDIIEASVDRSLRSMPWMTISNEVDIAL